MRRSIVRIQRSQIMDLACRIGVPVGLAWLIGVLIPGCQPPTDKTTVPEPVALSDQLTKVCEMEAFADALHVDRAIGQLMTEGRMFDAISLLEQAIEKHPDQHLSRRSLYEAYLSIENLQRASIHGRYLVKARQFDTALLYSLGGEDARKELPIAMTAMVRRYPADRRPLIAEARSLLNRGDMEAAADLLRQILELHPIDLPSFVTLGRIQLATDDIQGFADSIRSFPNGIENDPTHWINLGDWYSATNQAQPASRCYWESTQRDPDRQESWAKLARSVVLQSSDSNHPSKVNNSQLNGIRTRAEKLGCILQLKRDFRAQLLDRGDLAIELAKTHQSLGHAWEAEAWTAVVRTISPKDTVAAEEVRQSIVAQLNRNTPWQQTESRPEFSIDLSDVSLPPVEFIDSPQIIQSQNRSAEKGSFVLNDEASERNLDFFGRPAVDLDRPGVALYQTTGCGGGCIDFDLDGWPDLYLVTAGGTPPDRDSAPNGLFRNQEGRYLDVTLCSTTGDTGFGQGVGVGDVNEDGFADLLVLNYGPNVLLINNGDGTFSDQSIRLRDDMNQRSTWSSSGAIADLDLDGLSDVVVLNYCAGLGAVKQPCPREGTNIVRSCAPITFPAATDRFLKSDPTGNLNDVTETWGAIPAVPGRGLGLTIGSFDDRPGNDVFVANDMTVNHFWSGSVGSGFRLVESAIVNGLGSGDRAVAQGSMGIVSHDFDFDGDTDMLVTNFIGETNTYHEQVAPNIWRDQTIASGLGEGTYPMVAFGTQAIDLDNDGVVEVVVTNGHIDDFSEAGSGSPYAQPMQVFRAASTISASSSGPVKVAYELVSDSIQSEYLRAPHIGRSLWTLDANRDGRTDFAVTHQSESVALLVNRTPHAGHWIDIHCIGSESARDAVGTQIELVSNEVVHFQSVIAGDGYMCSNEQVCRFGLGETESPCDVTVRWPNGKEQHFTSLDVDSRWVILEGDPEAFRLSSP